MIEIFKDLCLGGLFKLVHSSISCKLGCGSDIDFRRNNWLGYEPLKFLFHGLFVCVQVDKIKIRDIGQWINGVWSWNIAFNLDSLPRTVVGDCKDLHNIIAEVKPISFINDHSFGGVMMMDYLLSVRS